MQILPAVWKAEKREPEVNHMDTEEEVVERKLWAPEKVIIPARSAKLVKVRTEGSWTGAGVVESLPLGSQEKGRNIILPENVYNLSKCTSNICGKSCRGMRRIVCGAETRHNTQFMYR